jgi:hypothetical protein
MRLHQRPFYAGWLLEERPQNKKRRDSFEDYGGEGNQQIGSGWDADTTTRADGIGECELVIDGIRWVEIGGEWVREEDVKDGL